MSKPTDFEQPIDPGILRMDQMLHRQDLEIRNQLEIIRLLKVVTILQFIAIMLAGLAWLIKVL